MSSANLLTQLRERVVVDVDSMDPTVASRHAQDARFCDMTSNQGIAFAEVAKPERIDVLREACKRAKRSLPDAGVDEQIVLALDIMVGTSCAHS